MRMAENGRRKTPQQNNIDLVEKTVMCSRLAMTLGTGLEFRLGNMTDDTLLQLYKTAITCIVSMADYYNFTDEQIAAMFDGFREAERMMHK